jgi:hypothetical protein
VGSTRSRRRTRFQWNAPNIKNFTGSLIFKKLVLTLLHGRVVLFKKLKGAAMSRVIIDIHDKSKEKALIEFLKSIPFVAVLEKQKTKGVNRGNFRKLYGLWKGRKISLKEIKSAAWDRKR